MLPQDIVIFEKVDREKMCDVAIPAIHQFPAQFDHSKTLSSADEGLVRLTCPPEFQKMCGTVNDHQWRWGLSGSKLNDIGQVIKAGLNCFRINVGCEFSTNGLPKPLSFRNLHLWRSNLKLQSVWHCRNTTTGFFQSNIFPKLMETILLFSTFVFLSVSVAIWRT